MSGVLFIPYLCINKNDKRMRDFIDTDFEDVPMRVHYEYEKDYDRVTITKVTHNGNDCTSLAVALCGDLLEERISESENVEYSPEHDD